MSKTLKVGVNNPLGASAQGEGTKIGPLTTLFAPAPDCDYKCFGPSTTALVDTLCSIYSSDCSSIRRSCLPDGSGSWVPGGFYSPGIICPNGWTTATTIEFDPSHSANSLLHPTTLIGDGEMAALCCPQGLVLQLQENTAIAPFVKGAYCVTTLLNSQLSYWTCKATDQPSGSPTKAEIGTSWWQTTNMRATRTTTVELFSIIRPSATPYTSTWTMFDFPTTVIQPTLFYAFTVAPAIQLVWRTQDRTTPMDTTTLMTTLPAETQFSTTTKLLSMEVPTTLPAETQFSTTTKLVSVEVPATLPTPMLPTAPGTTLVRTSVSTPTLVSKPPSLSTNGQSSTSLSSSVPQPPGNQSSLTTSPATAHLPSGALAAIVACSTLVALCSLLGVAWLIRRALRRRKALAAQNGEAGDDGGSEPPIPLGPQAHKQEPSQRISEIDTPFPPETPQAASWTSYELAGSRQYFELGHAGGSEVPVSRPEPVSPSSTGALAPDLPLSMTTPTASDSPYFYRG